MAAFSITTRHDNGNAATVLSAGALVLAAVVLHNGLGYALGYGVARALRVPVRSARTVSIEVGMQNSGLAATLAATYLSPLAALPGAVFSVWHNVSGSIIAGIWSRRPPRATSGPAFPAPRSSSAPARSPPCRGGWRTASAAS